MAFSSRSPGVEVLNIDYGAGGKGIHGGSWGKASVFYKPGFVAKKNRGKKSKPSPDMLPAIEWIASRLATAIGLPTPTGQIGSVSGHKVWVSLAVKLNSEDVAPPDPSAVVSAEPKLAAGTFVFDTWIFNNDRHDENILFHKDLGLWLIDHDQALSGPTMTDTIAGLPAFENRALTEHVFRELVAENHLADWVKRIQTFPLSVVKGIIEGGHRAGVYPKTYGQGIVTFLDVRRSNLTDLVARSRPMVAPELMPAPVIAATELTLDGGGAT